MTDETTSNRASRVRASERAVKIAIKAMADSGLQVSKLVVIGATIEVHACFATDAGATPGADAPGLKDW